MKKTDLKLNIKRLLEEANEYRFSDSRRAIEISQQVISLCTNNGYELEEKVAKLYIADGYHNIGENEDALPLLLESLQYCIQEEYQDLRWLACNLLGVVFFHVGDIETSMDFYDNAMEAAKEIDTGKKYYDEHSTKKSSVLTLNNIAENYKILANYEEAMKYGLKAYEIDAQFDFSLSRGLIVLTLGEIFYLLCEYEKACDLAHKALECLEKYKYTIVLADAYKLMALTSWKKGEHAKADEYFHIAMDLNERESVPIYKIDSLIGYAEYLKERKRINEAQTILIDACELSIQYKIVEKTSRISILLASLYGELGEFEQAYHYSKLHCEYEELHIESNNQNIMNALNVKKKMRAIERDNNKMAEKNKELQMQKQSLQMLLDKISIISTLGQKITSTLNMDSLMEILYSGVISIMDLSFFAIGLYNEKDGIITYSYAMDKGTRREPTTLSIHTGKTFAGTCIKSKEPVIVNDTSKEFNKFIDKKAYERMMQKKNTATLKSLIFCPLIVNTKIIGIITVQSEEKDAFSQFHVEMVKSLSSYAAIAINNAIKSKELEDLNQVLVSLSEQDQLTGIANRRKFDDYIMSAWESGRKYKKKIAMLMVDVDYYKEFNDNYGHIEGDKCIIRIAKVLESIDALPHFAARYGGDEFVVVLPDCSPEDAFRFGEAIKSKVANLNIPHEFSKISDRVTLSIGVACVVPDKATKIKDFMRKVDEALYIAKKRGKDQVYMIDNKEKSVFDAE